MSAARKKEPLYFIAEKGPGGVNGDTFLCELCNDKLGAHDPSDDAVEVWEIDGRGWLATIHCRVCGVMLAEKDEEVTHG